MDSGRVTEELKEHLCVGGEGGVVMGEYGDIWDDVRSLIDQTEGKIWVSLPDGIYDAHTYMYVRVNNTQFL